MHGTYSHTIHAYEYEPIMWARIGTPRSNYEVVEHV